MPWCIYTLTDPRTGAVRYVGTSATGTGRLETHVAEMRWRTRGRAGGPLTPKVAWLAELDRLGLLPVLSIVDTYLGESTRTERQAVERQWIDAFLEAGAQLTNTHMTPEHRRSALAGWERRRRDPTWLRHANR